MRVLICGSRGWSDPEPIDALIAGYDVIAQGQNRKLTIIQGGARGADTLAKTLGKAWGAEVITEEADWNQYGKAAGPIRNKKMLDDHDPEIVYAFRSSGKSKGTEDMVRQAMKKGVPTYVITKAGDETNEDD